jgi:hypothetical protein
MLTLFRYNATWWMPLVASAVASATSLHRNLAWTQAYKGNQWLAGCAASFDSVGTVPTMDLAVRSSGGEGRMEATVAPTKFFHTQTENLSPVWYRCVRTSRPPEGRMFQHHFQFHLGTLQWRMMMAPLSRQSTSTPEMCGPPLHSLTRMEM